MSESKVLGYTDLYRSMLVKAIADSVRLGFMRPALISPEAQIDDTVLRATNELLNEMSVFLNTILPGYWGNSCQTLSTHIFAHLNHQRIAANIVLGNVFVNGTNEFKTTLEYLEGELLATEHLKGDQRLHAWISLGGDSIVDVALPPRLVRHYNAPEHFNDMMFIGHAAEMVARYKVEYQPILVGTEFFARTNPPDPMDLLNKLQAQRT